MRELRVSGVAGIALRPVLECEASDERSRSRNGGKTVIGRLFSRLPRGLLLGIVPGLLVIGASGAHPAYATAVDDIINFNGKCLSVENVGPVIDTCDGTQRQDWKIDNVPNHPNDNLIRSDLTGDCLSIKNNNTHAGAQVNTFTCDFNGGNSFELWTGENPGVAGFIWIANQGDLDAGSNLVMHPSGCGATDDLGIFMNAPGQCNADLWHSPFTPS
jgi:hypothetical protein